MTCSHHDGTHLTDDTIRQPTMSSSSSSPMLPRLPPDAQRILRQSSSVEELAADIGMLRNDMIALDRKRQELVQALASYRPRNAHRQGFSSTSSSSWVCMDQTFVKLPAAHVKAMLEKDKRALDDEIETMRRQLKDKMLQLQQFAPSELDDRLVQFALRESRQILRSDKIAQDRDDDDDDADDDDADDAGHDR